MAQALPYILLAVALAQLALLFLVFRRASPAATTEPLSPADLDTRLARLESALREEFARNRQESSSSALDLRTEVLKSTDQLRSALESKLEAFRETTASSFLAFGTAQQDRFNSADAKDAEHARSLRQEVVSLHESLSTTLLQRITQLNLDTTAAWSGFNEQLAKLSAAQQLAMESLRTSVTTNLGEIRADNEKRLEEMRKTVDEKLQSTLETRLGESFKLVSERLENVQKGLGEMQVLASGVGDLKKVLTNVKTRGTWGEVLLGNLLEQVLAPEHFAVNVAVTGRGERVEFAVKLPGRPGKSDLDEPVWLPIDSKFPKEDYERLLAAQEAGNLELASAAATAMDIAIKKFAQSICDKYIETPKTTDFALMFLPSESLYAEVIRRPGIVEYLQRECRVIVTGPTTLAALLSSLLMGFRTLAIQKRSGEVWDLLGAVKTEFSKYADIMSKVKKQLEAATNTLDQTEVRTRAINKKLRAVEQMDAEKAALLLSEESPEDPLEET